VNDKQWLGAFGIQVYFLCSGSGRSAPGGQPLVQYSVLTETCSGPRIEMRRMASLLGVMGEVADR
jgi:hypothetical protein